MSAVIPFPSPMSDERTPPAAEVIVAPLADMWVACCIIRKDDGAMELFALAAGETWGDSDESYVGDWVTTVS